MKKPFLVLFCILVSVLWLENGARAEPPIPLSKGQKLYVPVYSHIYSGDKERPFNLTVTVSIRNTDPKHPIAISSVDFFDTAGILLKRYLEKPKELRPMESIRYIIAESDKKGGSGANFIVDWVSEFPANLPVVESVMIGTQAQQGISFTSRAQAIDNHVE